jgi:hypothetical protein
MLHARILLFIASLALSSAAVVISANAVPTTIVMTKVRKPILDFQTWHGDDKTSFKTREAELLYALSVAATQQRQNKRFALARFYLANEMPTEALSVLTVMVRTPSAVLASPLFLAVRGTAYLQVQRMGMAAADLHNAALDAEPQILLLRTHILQKLDRNEDALENFERGQFAVSAFPQPEAAMIQLSAARAALHLGKRHLARKILSQINKPGLAKAYLAEVYYLSAQIQAAEGRFDVAKAGYKMTALQGQPKFVALAAFSELEQDHRQGLLSDTTAIAKLRKLQYVWRGDDVERQVLYKLGSLEADKREWRGALVALRQATTYIPATSQTDICAQKMRAIFVNLFSGGNADTLPPLEALSLFSDFRELVPLGAEGDQMIRQLSDRLIAVGLPDRAAGLLDHQVRHRLSGTPQAVVAIRLALVQLSANKPVQALDVLRLTQRSAMPEDILQLHRQVEARALIQLNMVSSAFDVLDTDASRTADYLRADAYWRTRQWARLERIYLRLYAQQAVMLGKADQRQVLRWAYALAMADMPQAKRVLATRFGTVMGQSTYARAFAVLTSAGQTSTADINSIAPALADIDQLYDLQPLYKFDSPEYFVPKRRQSAATAVPPFQG